MDNTQLLLLVLTIVGTQFGALWVLLGRIDRVEDKLSGRLDRLGDKLDVHLREDHGITKAPGA